MSWLSWDVWQIPLEACLFALLVILPFALHKTIWFAWQRRHERRLWEQAARPAVSLAQDSKRVLREIRGLKGVPEDWTRDRV